MACAPEASPCAGRRAHGVPVRRSLAEFDGAISRLFRKTGGLDRLPQDMPNSYTVTLWDLSQPTWVEVDVVVDERLARKPDGTGLRGLRVARVVLAARRPAAAALAQRGGGGGRQWRWAALRAPGPPQRCSAPSSRRISQRWP